MFLALSRQEPESDVPEVQEHSTRDIGPADPFVPDECSVAAAQILDLESCSLGHESRVAPGDRRVRKSARVVKLTDRNVRTLPAIEGRRTDYTDEFMPGFILRVSPTGHRSYCVVYGSGPNKARYTVAPLHRMSL